MDADEERRAAVRCRPAGRSRTASRSTAVAALAGGARARHVAYPTRPREPWLVVFTDAGGDIAELTIPAASAAEAVGQMERRA
ncbi:hypothetical protein NUM_72690 [Actinocatenispora comari]|uniref:Uncharacterized protein n=1 Tax=Actinocatenispora comari TaxID=2807577 RepID=A0A8J4AM85_9ACTN|nr:hypothetical protein NUM_72690 [Actinocatenispora comari]